MKDRIITHRKVEADNPILQMTDAQVVAFMTADLPMPRARQAFMMWCARIEQAQQQREKPTAIELRRMEFNAVVDILRAHGKGANMKIQLLRQVFEKLLYHQEVQMPASMREIIHDALKATDHKSR